MIPLRVIACVKPHPAWNVSFLLLKKKRGSGRFLSQGFAFDFSALFSRSIFRVFCEKCAARRLRGSRFRFLETTPAFCTQPCEKRRIPERVRFNTSVHMVNGKLPKSPYRQWGFLSICLMDQEVAAGDRPQLPDLG
ncbi:MAG: hypothetical protein H7834_08835 [Magnetococcus sp. YQC-9]